MIGAVASALGREVKVYVSPAAIQGGEPTGTSRRPDDDLPDDYYDFTAADYVALQASKPKEEIHLKTKKIREREKALAAKKTQRTKATIRVHFPDGFVVESTFKATETIADIMELVRKSITRQDLAFYLYTTPPKRPFKNLQQNMIDANLCPGANVYFSFTPSPAMEVPREGPYLRPEVQELRDLHKLVQAPTDTGLSPLQDPMVMEQQQQPSPPPANRPAERKIPKWLKR
jgi:tether containing UBX domain for GLUT4